ncbi:MULTISPECIES: NAD-dependent epimerase/dehydratase family protein [unclassified Moraxella]|uniref:NAD-dependent epimerase/dehydratase family protein n=1 Tax=unclassified Moraxella TaxID=2685852 RepID=UPI003AF62759
MSGFLIIGLGKIGLSVANTLAEQGEQVIAVNRSPRPTLNPNIALVQKDARLLTINDFGSNAQAITHACIIVSPTESTEQGYRDSYFAISENFAKLANDLPKLQRVVFISSTSVYGQNTGDIIDINTPLQPPTAKTAQMLLQTEGLLQQNFGDKCTIIRPSGIYGKDRLRLVKISEQLANNQIELPVNSWTNRIFDTDLVTVIVKVLQANQPLPLYLATDFEPVPMFEVLAFLAKQQNLILNLPTQTANTGKRLISNLPQNWLHYPNYQTGYQKILSYLT